MSMIQVNIMHVLVLSPTLFYIGILNNNDLLDLQNTNIDLVFNMLLSFTILLLFIVRNNFIKKIFNINSFNKRNWINLIHYILFFPLLLYISLQKRNLSNIMRYICVILSITIFFTHIYHLYHKLIIVNDSS